MNRIPSLTATARLSFSLVLIAVLPACSTEVDAEPRTAAAPAAGADSPEPQPKAAPMATSSEGIYALQADALDGRKVDLSTYAGKVSLIVNVASACGYTPQYAGLQKLHEELGDRGFQVLGFPCNDFGGQEPGSAAEIQSFCSGKYGVTFPMFAKVAIKGDAPAPIYRRLIEKTGETPSWNFCKYLVGKDGNVLGFWKSGTAPNDAELLAAIEQAL